MCVGVFVCVCVPGWHAAKVVVVVFVIFAYFRAFHAGLFHCTKNCLSLVVVVVAVYR